ncbi:MAG: alpha/beta fold hydrolase [Halosimplex sp.]
MVSRPTGGGRDATGGSGSEPIDFETAQRALFEVAGLDVRSRFVDLGPSLGRAHVFETGPSNGEVPLAFVHGTDLFGASFAPLLRRLGDVRCVAFDRPGYGLSDPFAYTEGNVRKTCVDSLAGALDGAGIDRADVVGHSMGGHAALLFARSRPERVRRLVLLGGLPGFPGTSPPIRLRLLTAPVLTRVFQRLRTPDEAAVLEMADTFGEAEAIRDHPELVRAIAAHERDPKAGRTGVGEFGALVSLRGWRPSVRIGDADLDGVRAPTLLIWGRNDPLGRPEDVREAAGRLPEVRFEETDTGHIPFLGRPGRCAELIREARGVAADAGT